MQTPHTEPVTGFSDALDMDSLSDSTPPSHCVPKSCLFLVTFREEEWLLLCLNVSVTVENSHRAFNVFSHAKDWEWMGECGQPAFVSDSKFPTITISQLFSGHRRSYLFVYYETGAIFIIAAQVPGDLNAAKCWYEWVPCMSSCCLESKIAPLFRLSLTNAGTCFPNVVHDCVDQSSSRLVTLFPVLPVFTGLWWAQLLSGIIRCVPLPHISWYKGVSLGGWLGLMIQRWWHPCWPSCTSDNDEPLLTLTIEQPLPHLANKT